jgi:hypothetical protein
MVVRAVGHQHRIDRRQRVERDAGIVDPFRSGKADRGGALRPHGIAQQVDTARLDEKARMADEADPDRCSGDAGGRMVRIGARRPFRPFFSASGGHPPQHVEGAFRRRAMGVVEPGAVEMIRHRPVVIGRHQRAQPAGPAAAAAVIQPNRLRRDGGIGCIVSVLRRRGLPPTRGGTAFPARGYNQCLWFWA